MLSPATTDRLVRDRLGATLTRIGLWPKRLLPYRIAASLRKITWGHPRRASRGSRAGQQFVASGIHPDTGVLYEWVGGTPLEVPFADIPAIGEAGFEALGVEVEAVLPSAPGVGRPHRRRGMPVSSPGPVRDASGRVVDGLWIGVPVDPT